MMADKSDMGADRLFHLILEDREDYLYGCVIADAIDMGISISFVNELISHLRGTHYRNVLIVTETPGMIYASCYSVIVNVLLTQLPENVNLAIVDRSRSHEVATKEITTQRHYPCANIRDFRTFEEGEAWLLGSRARHAAGQIAPTSEPAPSARRS